MNFLNQYLRFKRQGNESEQLVTLDGSATSDPEGDGMSRHLPLQP